MITTVFFFIISFFHQNTCAKPTQGIDVCIYSGTPTSSLFSQCYSTTPSNRVNYSLSYSGLSTPIVNDGLIRYVNAEGEESGDFFFMWNNSGEWM
jgi:hypothetical protein